MTITALELHQLYLAYFGRPGDVDGMAYYTANPAFDVWSVCTGFSNSPESQALYGPVFGAEQVNLIYLNLFNRPAEPDGIAYWTGRVRDGHLTPAGAAYAILVGAQNEDAICVANKLAVAQAFFAALDQEFERVGYAGDNAAAEARAFLATVDRTEGSLHNGLFDMDGTVLDVITPDVPPPPPPPVTQPPVTQPPATQPPVTQPPVTQPPVTQPPVTQPPVTQPPVTQPPVTQPPSVQNFTFATDDNVVGTGGSDIFTATAGTVSATFNAGDSLDGGNGDDTLSLNINGSAAVPAISIRNVESIGIKNTSGALRDIDARNFGAQARWFYSDNSSASLRFVELRQDQIGVAVFDNSKQNTTIEFLYGAAATTAEIEISGTINDTLKIGGAGVTSTTVDFTTASATVKLLELTGNMNTQVLLEADGNLLRFDNLTSAAASTVTVTGAANALKLDRVSGVREVDARNFAGDVEMFAFTADVDSNFVFRGGDGDDTYHLRFAPGANGGAFAGSGTEDTLIVYGNHVNGTTGGRFSGFENLRVLNGASVNVAHLGAQIQKVAVSPGSGTTGVTGIDEQEVLVTSSFNGTLTLGLADSSTLEDQVNLRVDAAGAAASLGRIVMNNVEILGISTESDLTLTDMSGINGLRTINLHGAGLFDMTLGAGTYSSELFVDMDEFQGGADIDASGATMSNGLRLYADGNGNASILFRGTAAFDQVRTGAARDFITYTGGRDDYDLGGGGDTVSFAGIGGEIMGDGAGFTLSSGDSKLKLNVPNGAFNHQTAFDPLVTDVISGISNAQRYEGGNGAKFFIQVIGARPELAFDDTVVLGTTSMPRNGFFVLDYAGESNTAYVFQDADGDATVSALDVMVKLVGDAGFNVAEFRVEAGGTAARLEFQSVDAD